MLKQAFNKERAIKLINKKDSSKWRVYKNYGGPEPAAKIVADAWEAQGVKITSLVTKKIKNRTIYMPSTLQDHLAIKLTDMYLRRIYKVRQSDRNRMIRQVITLMKDPNDLAFIRLDIKDCFESIIFYDTINKLKQDLIISPSCIKILKSIHEFTTSQGSVGLPRGLSISATLAELYLEKIDRAIAVRTDAVYIARYVDDIIIVTSEPKAKETQLKTEEILREHKLSVNSDKNYIYTTNQIGDGLELLGYSISKSTKKNSANIVSIKISKSKTRKIKRRIVLSFINYKKNGDFKLLLDRIYYLSTLRTVKRSKNGNLLAGNAFNYMYATNFNDLKKIDGFYLNLVGASRFSLSASQRLALQKISFYRMAAKRKVMNITRKRTLIVKEAWIND